MFSLRAYKETNLYFLFAFFLCLYVVFILSSKVITRSEQNVDVVLFSEGAVVPCAISADSSLLQITMQLVQVIVSPEQRLREL